MKPEIAEGFSQKVAMGKNPEMREAVQERFRTQVSHLQTRLNAIRAEIGTEGAREALVREPHAAQSFTPVTLSRRVLLSTNQQLNIEDIQTLNKVYSAEQEFLQKTQQATLTALWQEKSGGWDPHAFTGEERVGLLSAVHQKVRSVTDVFTKSNDLTSFSTGPAAPANPAALGNAGGQGNAAAPERNLLEDHELLLEDYFEIAQEPNEAEFIMLEAALDVDIDELVEWFEEKQQKSSKFFWAKEIASKKGRANKANRKQRLPNDLGFGGEGATDVSTGKEEH